MQLQEISFPVYKLEKLPPSKEDGVVFYIKRDKLYVIDDTTVEGDTLAKRRLKLTMDGVKLHKLKYSIFFLADLIKLSSPTQWFIDSKGKCFVYTKHRNVPLVFRPITNVIRNGALQILIEAQNIPGRHKSLYAPTKEQKYAGFLKLSAHSYLLYGYFSEKYEDTRRKI